MESEDSAEEDKEEQDYMSGTPAIKFKWENDSDKDYNDDTIKIPCFRVVVSRETTSVSDSESEDTTDSAIESQSSG